MAIIITAVCSVVWLSRKLLLIAIFAIIRFCVTLAVIISNFFFIIICSTTQSVDNQIEYLSKSRWSNDFLFIDNLIDNLLIRVILLILIKELTNECDSSCLLFNWYDLKRHFWLDFKASLKTLILVYSQNWSKY